MGEAHARALAAEGARVVIGDVLEPEGAAVADEPGDDARFAALDVTDEGSWQAAVSFAEDAFGPISVLVNNAGVLAIEPLAELAIEEWRRVIDTNLTGAFLGMKTVHPSMRRAGGGAIVNVSSMAARFGRSEEVAATMLHIVCDATYSTGSEFCVDGGILAGISVGD